MHRLALALGRTVAELDATMSPEEYDDWKVYYAFEPWGSPIEDQRFGVLYSLYYNVNFKGDVPFFLDRDREETRRKAVLPDDDLDDQMEAFFERRIARQG